MAEPELQVELLALERGLKPTPWISSFCVKPVVTPTTRLFTSVRLMPHMAAARSMSLFGVTVMPFSPMDAVHFLDERDLEFALGALQALTVFPLTEAVTPFGKANCILADTRHNLVPQNTWQRTSPPTFFSRAWVSVITPCGVETIDTPRP